MLLLSLHFCYCNKTLWPKAVQGRKGFWFVFSSQATIVGSQKPWRNTACWMAQFIFSCLVVFSIWSRILCTREWTLSPTVDRAYSSINNQDSLWKTCLQGNLMWILPQWDLPSPVSLGCGKLTELTRQYLRNNAWGRLLTSTVTLTNMDTTHMNTCACAHVYTHAEGSWESVNFTVYLL